MRALPYWTAIAVAGGAGACGKGAPPDRTESPVEAQIRHSLGAQLASVGAEVQAVICTPPRCSATLVGGGELTLTTAAGAGGAVDWSLDGMVIAASPLEAYVRDQLADLGVTAAVSCGVRARLAHVGDRIDCAIGAPIGGAAWATVRDPAGAITVEIALGDDAARVRTTEVDSAALERMSLALDRDGDDDSDDGPDDGDGGVEPVDGDGGVQDAGGDRPSGDAGLRDARGGPP